MYINTFLYTLISLVTSANGFLSSLYIANVITASQFGVIGIFQVSVSYTVAFVSFGCLSLVSINYIKKENNNYYKFSNTYFSFGIILVILLTIFSLIAFLFYKKYLVFFLAIPFFSALRLFIDFHIAEIIQLGKIRLFAIYTITECLLASIVTFALIYFLNMTWEARIFGLIIGQLVVLFIQKKASFSTLEKITYKIDMDELKCIVSYGFPSLISVGAGWLLLNADRIIVAKFYSIEAVGNYAIAASFGISINTFNQSITNSLIPYIHRHLNNSDDYKKIVKWSVAYGCAVIVLALIVGIGSYWYMPILFGNKYPDSQIIILCISIAYAFNGIYRIPGNVIEFYQRAAIKTKLLYASAIFGIGSTLVLMPYYGDKAPAIGSMLGLLSLALFSHYYAYKIFKKEKQIL